MRSVRVPVAPGAGASRGRSRALPGNFAPIAPRRARVREATPRRTLRKNPAGRQKARSADTGAGRPARPVDPLAGETQTPGAASAQAVAPRRVVPQPNHGGRPATLLLPPRRRRGSPAAGAIRLDGHPRPPAGPRIAPRRSALRTHGPAGGRAGRQHRCLPRPRFRVFRP